jgi:hypothetical protein
VRFTGGGEFMLGLFDKNGKTTAFMVVNRSYRQDPEAAVKVVASAMLGRRSPTPG